MKDYKIKRLVTLTMTADRRLMLVILLELHAAAMAVAMRMDPSFFLPTS
jgi:hypothetical protein